jgi:hypothetical protein
MHRWVGGVLHCTDVLRSGVLGAQGLGFADGVPVFNQALCVTGRVALLLATVCAVVWVWLACWMCLELSWRMQQHPSLIVRTELLRGCCCGNFDRCSSQSLSLQAHVGIQGCIPVLHSKAAEIKLI